MLLAARELLVVVRECCGAAWTCPAPLSRSFLKLSLFPFQSFLYSINQTICLRLDSIEAKLQALEATCKSLEEKLDLVTNKQHSPIQVPMVAGSPLGATQTCNKVRW